jgi:hypothetical protein
MEEFNISNWRFRHLFTEGKEPIGEQPIEEQPTDEVSKNEDLVDEIGEFWVVFKPTKNSVKEDILFETDMFGFGLMIKGGLKSNSILGIYKQKSDANRIATGLLKQRDMDLKEVEELMNDFRESKKSINDKKTIAKNLINKLK